MQRKANLLARLRIAYETTKKELLILLLLLAVVVDMLPTELFFRVEVANTIKTGLMLPIAFILLELLFKIYDAVLHNRREVKIIKSNDLLGDIGRLCESEREINIKYIGVAGRHGWSTVIARFLDPSSEMCLLSKKQIVIEIALLAPQQVGSIDGGTERYSVVQSVLKEIEFTKQRLQAEGMKHVTIKTYLYEHTPNFLGFLVNDNYLFTSLTYWEYVGTGEKYLRGGGTDYIVYDKNDGFGGAYYLKRFESWFCHCVESTHQESYCSEEAKYKKD
ncbi:hypothetical protein CKO50_09775 [Pseudoalteromonas sp. HM-SA03]|uniref:hypothetical protein n=1 Tax=Pseudoalteromonas sp. HM-SA03 TaxID=2029678 RepID=UPI000BAE5C8C|nr:hypothetical protein [Pseudoalteromonas sp. HM-SA03]PAY01610.1 hypothetical protein CKO50_09775 [Pseudoalteromonas sp. HM-SA03]